MGRPRSIDRMPEIKTIIDKLIRKGHFIDEIKLYLEEYEDHEIARSTLGEYVKQARERMEQYATAREIAGQWIENLGEDDPNRDLGSVIVEMGKMIALYSMAAIDPTDADTKICFKEIASMAKAIRDLELSSKNTLERRQQIRKLALAEAAKEVKEQGKKMGISEDALSTIEEKLLNMT